MEYGVADMLDSMRAFTAEHASVDECLVALAQSVVVATALQRPTPDVRDPLLTWVHEQGWEPSAADVEIASSVVAAIVESSALRRGWGELEPMEPGIVDEWCDAMEDFQRRLV